MASENDVKLEGTLLELVNQKKISLEQALKIQKELNEELKRSVEYLDEENKKLEFQKKVIDQIADEQGRIIEKEEIKIQIAINAAKKEEEQAKAQYKAAGENEAARQAAINKFIKSQKDLTKELEKQKELLRAKEAGEGLAKLLGIDESNKNSLTYQIFANPAKVFDAFKSKIEDSGGAMKATFLSVAMKVQEASVAAFFAFDSAAASLNKATGAAGSLNNVLAETARGSTRFGISFEEAGKATEGLYNNLFTFNSLSQSTQALLITNAAKLEQLGISSVESAKSIAALSQVMGQSDVQSSKTINQMAALGLAIGKSPQQISQDFSQAAGNLAGYGNRMVDVFKDLEIQSKATGIAVDDLMGVVEKFQTFEGAATAAGKLNAALGGNFINTMELLEASAENPAKAIDLIRSRLDEAGVSFEEMSFFEKKMIADAAGFKSVLEASQVLSMTNAQREKAAKADAQRADAQKKLDDAIQASIPATTKFNMIMANFAVAFGPALEMITATLNVLGKFSDTILGKGIGAILGLTFVAAGLLKTFLFIGSTFTAAKTSLIGFNATAAVTEAEMAVLATETGVVATEMGGIAAASGPAAAGLSAANASLVPATAGATAATPAFAAFGVALLEAGAGAALLGVGVAGLGFGISQILDSLSGLTSIMTKDFASSMLDISIAMNLFGSPLAILGMTAFAIALSSIVETINELDERKSFNFSVITESLTKTTTVAGTATVSNIGQQTKDMVDAINTFSLSNTQATNLANILRSLPQNQPAPAAPANNQVVEVYIGQEKLTNLVTRIVNRQTTGTIGTPATLAPGSRTGT